MANLRSALAGTALALLSACPGTVQAQVIDPDARPTPRYRVPDRSKAAVEFPLKRVISGDPRSYPLPSARLVSPVPVSVPVVNGVWTAPGVTKGRRELARKAAMARSEFARELAANEPGVYGQTDDRVADAVRAVEADLSRRASRGALPSISSADENPLVKAGAVNWHQNLETACLSARHSGKPVLYFQMLGNLNQEFC